MNFCRIHKEDRQAQIYVTDKIYCQSICYTFLLIKAIIRQQFTKIFKRMHA